MNVFTLQAVLNLSNSEYKKSLKESLAEADTFGEKFKAVMSSDVYSSWSLIGQAIVEVGKQIYQVMQQSLEFADAQGDLAAKLGVSTESIGEMQYIASQTGTSVDTLSSSMSTLYTRAKSDGEAFQALGISVTDANGNFKSMDDLFYETIGALNSLEDEGAKSSAMLDLFGRSAMNNGELLRMSTEEIDAMKEKAHELGIVVDESTTDFAGEWFDKFDELSLQGQGVLASILSGEEGAEEKLQNFFDSVIELFDTYMPVFVSGGTKLLVQLAMALLKKAPSIASEIIGVLIDTILSMDWLQLGVDIGKSILEGLINALGSFLNIIPGVEIPKVDLGVGESIYTGIDTNTEYEISENVKQDITVKVEASGDTAVSSATAEETAKALAPYIDKILGGY